MRDAECGLRAQVGPELLGGQSWRNLSESSQKFPGTTATLIIKTDYPVENRATYYAWAQVRWLFNNFAGLIDREYPACGHRRFQ
jgi:hypothetical protein